MVLQNTGKYRADRLEKDDYSKRDTGPSTSAGSREESSETRVRTAQENDRIDSLYGFDRVRDVKERTGYMINMHTAEILDEDKRLVAAMDYYFIEMDGSRFKVSLAFQPYFLIMARRECEQEVIQYLSKKFAGSIHKIVVIEKEDLDLLNHLSGLKQRYVKLSFMSQNEMMKVRREILTAVNKNKEREKKDAIYAEMLTNALTSKAAIEHAKKTTDHMENILDIREHDVPYHVRVSTDMQIFCGTWYTVKSRGTDPPTFTKRDDILERPDPIVLAFDIETTKLPLKFPDSQTDQIMMISYMIDGQGYLITNREIISTDVEDFEYTPKPEFEGQFIIFNEVNELALIQKFFEHIMDVKPHIFVTYNGDFFDWPFVEARAAILGLDMRQEIGFSKMAQRDGTYACRPAMHMDCLW